MDKENVYPLFLKKKTGKMGVKCLYFEAKNYRMGFFLEF